MDHDAEAQGRAFPRQVVLAQFDHPAQFSPGEHNASDDGTRVPISHQVWLFLQAHNDSDDRDLICQLLMLVISPPRISTARSIHLTDEYDACRREPRSQAWTTKSRKDRWVLDSQ